MSGKFSPALRLADLNDFIAPSQACIVSLKGLKPKSEKAEEMAKPLSKPLPPSGEAVKISLKDCLACSGCVTSAETVMLEKQSLDEFLSHVNSDKAVIVSVSPKSRTSLATHFGLSPSQGLWGSKRRFCKPLFTPMFSSGCVLLWLRHFSCCSHPSMDVIVLRKSTQLIIPNCER